MSGVEVVQSKATFDESRITWTEAKTDKGATYHIGRLEEYGGPAASEAEGVSFGVGNGCVVNWEVGEDVWKDTTQQVKDTVDITRYNLHRINFLYCYILGFTSTQCWDYRFTDDSDDRYEVKCFRNGDHFLKYNSASPRINRVETKN